jgi:hypothetical protein
MMDLGSMSSKVASSVTDPRIWDGEKRRMEYFSDIKTTVSNQMCHTDKRNDEDS